MLTMCDLSKFMRRVPGDGAGADLLDVRDSFGEPAPGALLGAGALPLGARPVQTQFQGLCNWLFSVVTRRCFVRNEGTMMQELKRGRGEEIVKKGQLIGMAMSADVPGESKGLAGSAGEGPSGAVEKDDVGTIWAD